MRVSTDKLWKAWPEGFLAMRGLTTVLGPDVVLTGLETEGHGCVVRDDVEDQLIEIWKSRQEEIVVGCEPDDLRWVELHDLEWS